MYSMHSSVSWLSPQVSGHACSVAWWSNARFKGGIRISSLLLHTWVAHEFNGPLILCQLSFFFLFLFFSLSSSISTLKTSIFQSNHSICFSFKFCSFLLLFVLFEIIYKIRIVFQFHPLLIFNLSYLVPVLFVAIFYPFFSLVFNCIPRCFISFNFYTRFDHYYFDCYLFCFLSLDD